MRFPRLCTALLLLVACLTFGHAPLFADQSAAPPAQTKVKDLHAAGIALPAFNGPPATWDHSDNAPSLNLVHADLWARIRSGMQLHEFRNPRIDNQIASLIAGQSSLTETLKRAGNLLYMVVTEAESANVPLDFALLPVIESAYKATARSSKGAAGLWQFIPTTATYFGLRQGQWYDERLDVIASTRAAYRYLDYLQAQFDLSLIHI